MTNYLSILFAAEVLALKPLSLLFVSLILFVYQFLQTKRLLVSGIAHLPACILFLFGLSYVLFGYFSGDSLLMYLLLPMMMYLTGWVIVMLQKENADDAIKKIIYCMVLGFGIHALFNLQYSSGVARWEQVDFFTKEVRSATGLGSINTMISSLMLCIIIEKNRKIRIIGLLVLTVSVAYGFALGTRTQLLILIIVVAFMTTIYMHEKYRKTGLIRTIAVIAGIFIFGWLAYRQNLLGIREKIAVTNMFERFGDINTAKSDFDRINRFSQGIQYLLSFPLRESQTTGYFHNMWLDIARKAGIVPFAFMVCYSIITMKHAIGLLRDKKIDIQLRFMVLSIYLGSALNFLVEPAMEGFLHYFYCFCVINGMTDYVYYLRRSKNKLITSSIRKDLCDG